MLVYYESLSANETRTAVLVALDLLLGDTSSSLWLLVLGLLLVLLPPLLDVPEAALVEHATARQLHHAARLQLAVDGLCASRLLATLSCRCHFSSSCALLKNELYIYPKNTKKKFIYNTISQLY